MQKCALETCGRDIQITCLTPKRVKYCSDACRWAAKYERERTALGRKRRNAKHERPVSLGPDRPMHGWTETEASAYRERKALECLREGVPTHAVAERFNAPHKWAVLLARRHEIQPEVAWMAFGAPA